MLVHAASNSNPPMYTTSALSSSTAAMAQAEQMIEALVRQSRRLELAMDGVADKLETVQKQKTKPQEPEVPPSIEEFMAINNVVAEPIPAFPCNDYVDLSNLYFDTFEDQDEDDWDEYQRSNLKEHVGSGLQLELKPFSFASGAEEEKEDVVVDTVEELKKMEEKLMRMTLDKVKAAVAPTKLSGVVDVLDFEEEEDEDDDDEDDYYPLDESDVESYDSVG